MARKDFTQAQIEAMIIYLLARRGAWGEAYMPKDTMIRRLAKKVKNNGKNVKRVLGSLIQDGVSAISQGRADHLSEPFKEDRNITKDLRSLVIKSHIHFNSVNAQIYKRAVEDVPL